MRVLVACEFSGIVRDAFAARGHDAWSCDLLPSEAPGHHYEGDVLGILDPAAVPMVGWQRWDLAIMHPSCTYLASSGERWFRNDARARPGVLIGEARRREREKAIDFVKLLWGAPIERIAIENPIGVLSTRWQKPSQIIQPWQFGHGEVKATCLWLKGLPPLRPTQIVEGRTARVHRAPPGIDRWKERSRTLPGIAAAMAEQWG